MSQSEIDRRRFLELSAASAVSLTTGLGLSRSAGAQDAAPFEPRKQPGRIVKVLHSGALSDPTEPASDPVPEVVGTMVDSAMLLFTGKGDLAEAWAEFIHPSDQVMIKVNTLGSPTMATNRPVVEAIIRGLQAMGLPNEQMLVYDQYRSRMLRAHYRPGHDILGVMVEFNEDRGYHEDASEHGAGSSRFAVAVHNVTAIINVPVIKDHDVCGVTMALKNLTHGVIHNPSAMHRRNSHHTDERCTVHADIWMADPVRDKVRVIVADGLRVMYDGGPQDNSNKDVHNAIYVGTDPVALDTIGKDVVDASRAAHGMRSLADDGRFCSFLPVCEEYGLGIHDRTRITVEEHVLA
jgi:uncharacterized protein (DUF362 family)